MSKIKIYALYASDEPLQVRYVGKTARELKARLWQHRNQFCNPLKRAWTKEVERRGAVVEIRLLSDHNCPLAAEEAEMKWLIFWSSYCDTLNGCRPSRSKRRASFLYPV